MYDVNAISVAGLHKTETQTCVRLSVLVSSPIYPYPLTPPPPDPPTPSTIPGQARVRGDVTIYHMLFEMGTAGLTPLLNLVFALCTLFVLLSVLL